MSYASLTDLLTLPLFRNSLAAWSIACGTTFVVLVVLLLLRGIVRRNHERLLATPQTELIELPLDILSRTTLLFFIAVSAVAGLSTLSTSEQTERVLSSVVTIAFFWQAGVWMSAGVAAWLERKRRYSLTTDRASVSTIGLIGLIGRVAIWALVLLLTLDNVGVNISALIAGLGIGGVAVALAVQNILGDLFASLSIALDRPFIVGDFLVVGDVMGSVEYVGIKSTRLRSLSGEQVVMSNADLLSSRIRNYGRMLERRVLFTLNVTYETPAELLERIPKDIRRIVEAEKETRFDRCHFSTYGPHSLDFETVYYVLSPDYNRYMDIQQAINLAIFREFSRLGIEFAYPTRKIYVTALDQPVGAARAKTGIEESPLTERLPSASRQRTGTT